MTLLAAHFLKAPKQFFFWAVELRGMINKGHALKLGEGEIGFAFRSGADSIVE